MLESALEYLKKNKSIIPLKKDKRPFFEWREFQERRPTEKEVREWWAKYPEANIGIVTGKISGITVVDVDVQHGGKTDGLYPTLIVKTGNGGWHYYYQYEEGITIGAGIRQGVDLRGDGGFVVAPPSITDYTDKEGNKKGGKYEYALVEEIQPFPLDALPVKKEKIDWKKILEGVREGERNMTTASLAGKLISTFKKEDWETLAWQILLLWNRNNNPPDDEKTLRRTFESVMKKHIRGHIIDEEEIQIVKMSEVAKNQKDLEKIPCSMSILDEAMQGGIEVGSSVIIAAPTGEGKTAFMVSMSHNFLVKGYHTLWFSFEASVKDIWNRHQEAGTPEDIPAFCPIDLADNKLNFIEKAIEIKKKDTDFFVVFIDQLSYLAPKVDDKTALDKIQGNYSMYLGLISQQVKDMAMKHQIIIVMAHQLGRSGDVAYSDMIKHAPDKVIYLKREQAGDASTEEFTDKTLVVFKKNRPYGTRPRLAMTVEKGLFVPLNNQEDIIKKAQSIFGGEIID